MLVAGLVSIVQVRIGLIARLAAIRLAGFGLLLG